MPSPLLRALYTSTEWNLFMKKIKSGQAELRAKIAQEQAPEQGVKPQLGVSRRADLFQRHSPGGCNEKGTGVGNPLLLSHAPLAESAEQLNNTDGQCLAYSAGTSCFSWEPSSQRHLMECQWWLEHRALHGPWARSLLSDPRGVRWKEPKDVDVDSAVRRPETDDICRSSLSVGVLSEREVSAVWGLCRPL